MWASFICPLNAFIYRLLSHWIIVYRVGLIPLSREIGRIHAKDLSRDTSGTRAYSAFLVELAEKVPAVMMPSISVLLALLDGEVSQCELCKINVHLSVFKWKIKQDSFFVDYTKTGQVN